MNKNVKLALLLGVLCCLAPFTRAQTCILASCASSDCPNGCTGCSSASVLQLSEGQTSELCPDSGSFCFLGTITNGACSIQNCDACSSSTDPNSCTGCKAVTSQNSNSNHCDNTQCYSMSYSTASPASTTNTQVTSMASTSSGNSAGNTCVLSSCSSVNCPDGCANCKAASVVSIPTDGTSIEVCPDSASFCFTGSITNNQCTISNCDGCSSSDPSSCTNCQAINSNNANKDWCLNGNCYHMEYSSSVSSTASQGSGAGTSITSEGITTDQSLNCVLLQCNSGDCPNGCGVCSKATSLTPTDGNTAELCPSNGSFCFIASSTNGVCSVSSCSSCGSNPSACNGCQAITAQNSISNFCSNSQCYHMGYTSSVGGTVGTSSTNTSNGSSTGSTVTGNGGIASGSNGNSSVNLTSVTSSGLYIQVSSLLISLLVGGFMILF